MFELNLPKADVKLANRNGVPSIWDMIRKKWLVLTPEEYVRQHFLYYLTRQLLYPKSLISVEKGLAYNSLAKRTDIVIYGTDTKPFILVECKAPQVKISYQAIEQASIYNQKHQAPYVCVTNGLEHFYYHMDYKEGVYKQIAHLPTYSVLV